METETVNKELDSEVKSAAFVIKAHGTVDPRVVGEQLKGMWWRYRSEHRHSARLIAAELVKLNADEKLIAKFRRLYVGDE